MITAAIDRLLACGALSLLGACAYFEQPAWPPAPLRQAALTIPRDEEAPRDAPGGRGLVRSGTGFFVTHGGLLLTAAHVIADCPAISVWRPGRLSQSARLVATDPRHDLALVASGLAARQIVAAPTGRHLSIDDRILLAGFGIRKARPPALVLIGGAFGGDVATPGGAKAFVIHAEVPPGASGGPVVDLSGALVGMVIGYDSERPDLGIIVTNEEIGRFLAASGVGLIKLPARRRHLRATGHLLDGAVVLVQCAPQPLR